jgi:hypothetical protein
MDTASRFSVRIVWQSDHHSPLWELQTDHGGFDNWVAPALFANGFTSPHPWLLKLADGRVTIALDTGASVEVDANGLPAGGLHETPGLESIRVSAWHLDADALVGRDESDDELIVMTCGSYQELPRTSLADMSCLGLDGIWWSQSYEVLGPDGHIGVSLELDEAAETLIVVRDAEVPADADDDMAVLAFLAKL